MWLLIFTLVFDDGSEHPRFASEQIQYATEQQCREAQARWIENGEALPEGYTKPWRQLTGPECEPTAVGVGV